MDLGLFESLPLMGIIRGLSSEDLEPLVETVHGAGLRTLEITMNTHGAEGLISETVRLGHGMNVGAGTVLTSESAKKAVGSGASFLVSPVFQKEVAQVASEEKVQYFPGALTPQEVFKAWEGGAAMVKIFPARCMGPGYFKELKGPLSDVRLMAVGGVREDNIGIYFASGADAVAFGSSVFRDDLLSSKDFRTIGSIVEKYVRGIKESLKNRLS